MDERTNCWRNIGDMAFGLCTAMADPPPHQNKGDVAIIWIPCRMGCTCVNYIAYSIVGRVHNYLHISTPLMIVPIDDFLSNKRWHTAVKNVLHVYTILYFRMIAKVLDNGLSHLAVFSSNTGNGLLVENNLIVHEALNQIF